VGEIKSLSNTEVIMVAEIVPLGSRQRAEWQKTLGQFKRLKRELSGRAPEIARAFELIDAMTDLAEQIEEGIERRLACGLPLSDEDREIVGRIARWIASAEKIVSSASGNLNSYLARANMGYGAVLDDLIRLERSIL
jgi:hypothetical protein